MLDKTRLYVIEGQDRTGKDTLKRLIGSRNNKVKIYNPELTGLVDYHNKEEFSKWVKDHVGGVLDKLIELKKDNKQLMLTRLLVSDNVYSELFDRDFIVKKNFEKLINDNFDLTNIIILFRNYEEYLKRLQLINEEIQYNEEDFYKIINLYLKYSSKNDIIIFVDGNDTKEDLYNKFVKLINL